MAYSIQQILGHIPLTKSLRTNAKVPNPFPEELFTVRPENRVTGDRAQWITINTERKTAVSVPYGSPSVSRQLLQIGERPTRLLHLFENIRIDMNMLLALRSFEQYTQDRGRDWLNHQLVEAGRRVGNAELVATSTTLRFGAIYRDVDGNVLPNSTGAQDTFSFGVPATHQTQINSIVTASWALTNTDIPGHLRNLHQFNAQEHGPRLKTALYGINIPKYMMQNDFVQAHLVRNPSMNEKFLSTNEIPDGLFGFNWIPVYEGFIENAAGTNVELWDDDLIVFMPDISQPDNMDWWGMFEGSFMVPRSLNVQRDGLAVAGNFEETFGKFSYANTELDPPGATIRYGHTFLPGLRNPNAIYQMDTTP